MIIGRGTAGRILSHEEIRDTVSEAASCLRIDGQRLLVLIPDGTRTMPMPQMFSLFQELLRPRVRVLDYLVALGTHPLMTDEQLSKLIGRPVVHEQTEGTRIFNHHWEDPKNFAHLGTIPASEITQIT